MAFTREQIRDSIERAGDAHWQALIRHHTDAYPESPPTPGGVARDEAERVNALGLGDNPNLELVESRVERVPPPVRITHYFRGSLQRHSVRDRAVHWLRVSAGLRIASFARALPRCWSGAESGRVAPSSSAILGPA